MRVRIKHKLLWGRLNQREMDLRAQFKGGKVPAPILRPILMQREEIKNANRTE